MQLQELITFISEAFNISGENISDLKDRFCINVDDKYKVNVEEIEGSDFLLIYAFLFPDIEGNSGELALKALTYNNFGNITGSAVISYSSNQKMFILSERFVLSTLEKNDFLQRFKSFIGALADLRKKWLDWELEIMQTISTTSETKREIFKDLNEGPTRYIKV